MPNTAEDDIRRGKSEDIYRSRVTSCARNPQTMKPEEIATEMDSLRETLNLASQRMVELSRVLYTHIRRVGSADPTTPAYIAYANAWGRLAGAVQQGIRRTLTTNRFLDRAIADQKTDRDRTQSKAANSKKKSEESSTTDPPRSRSPFEENPLNDLMELYGSEIVRDARR